MKGLCEGVSDDCTGEATEVREQDYGSDMEFCAACATAWDNREPPDPDGEDIFRDYRAEERDQMAEARKLK